jgi:hypothetical protein
MRFRNQAVAGVVLVAAALSAGTPAQAAPAPVCSGGASEWAHCATVTATLDHAPATGETARLSITVSADGKADDLRVEVTLPASLRWASRPAGFGERRTASRVPADLGTASTISTTVDVAAGRQVKYEAEVTAVRAGPTVLRAKAVSDRGAEFGSQEVRVPLVVGATAKESRLGGTKGPDRAEATPAGTPLTKANPSVPYRKASTEGLPEPHSDDVPSLSPQIEQPVCVTGSFDYSDPNGNFHPAKNLQYQVWDEDIFGDDLLASGLADQNGAYRACFGNDDGIGGGGQDVYVRAVTEGSQYKVEDSDDDAYSFDSTVRNNVGNGRTYDFGRLHTANPVNMPAYHAYDTADDALAWTPGDCWDARDESCQNIDIEWEPGSTEGTYYDTGDDEVRLLGADPDTPWITVHELGHGVMDDVYEDNYPNIGSECDPHSVPGRSGPACAWTEGFADWFAAEVVNDPDIQIPGGGNIDTATWGTQGWDNGDQVEGRVAGSLWDLLDSGAEGTDNYQDTLANVWSTFLDHRSTNFAQWWAQRGQDGRDVSDAALGALFQNTIDYGFRQPLTDGAEITATTPPADHNYRFDTRNQAWSVVAVRPPSTADDDLMLFDDRAQTQQLESSLLVGVTDFVAIDSNPGRRALGDYYPRVHRVNGTGDYTVELADDGQTLTTEAKRQMNAGDVVAVWNSCLTAGQQVTFTVTPGDLSQDAELFVVSSQAGNTGTYVRDRAAAQTASAQGPGQPETLQHTAAADGCVGVIVINRAGTGTYTVTRS